ncbi:MAG: hypothetical protein KGH85_08590, partial [Thaumarchaeota archaeon]|nr:hypothetical protein [Nitrososphaerota archaeon]
AEVPRSMITGMAVLAAICIVLGILASSGISLITLAFHLPSQPSSPLDNIVLQNDGKNLVHLSMPTVLILFAAISVGIFGFIRTIGGKWNMGLWIWNSKCKNGIYCHLFISTNTCSL